MFIVPINRRDLVINLDNTKTIFHKKEMKEEVEKEYLKLYADENLIVRFSMESLEKYIKRNVLNNRLTKMFLELENIESFISKKNAKRIEEYGYKRIDSFIDSLIEVEDISKKIFEIYSENFAFRFITVCRRCKNEAAAILATNILTATIYDDLLDITLDKLDELDEKNN